MTFALATILIAGVNLYALALVLQLLLGWPILLGIVVAAGIVLAYITLGGLSSAIYNEVLQFFVIIAALVPLTIVGAARRSAAGAACRTRSKHAKLGERGLHALQGTALGHVDNPIGSTWIGLVFGLGLRALVRLLDDELRRGPARAVGQDLSRRPAHAADRRLPEAASSRS